MSESVDILIKAEDLATPVVAKSAKSVDALDASIKRLKTSGEQAKKSTEFFGSIANALGGSEIGGYASQLAGLTEKTSQFAEVQKLGGAGAFAFKAGLASVAGVLGFQVGKSIGDTIFQTERWTAAMEEAKIKTRELGIETLRLEAIRNKDDQEDIDLTRDPAERIRLTEKHADALAKQLGKVEDGAHATKAALKAITEIKAFNGTDFLGLKSGAFNLIAGNSVDQLKEQLIQQEATRKQLAETVRETEKLTNERTLANLKTKEENALRDKSDSYLSGLRDEVELLKAKGSEIAGINASKNAFGDEAKGEAVRLLQEKERLQVAEASAKSSASYVQSLREQVQLLRASGSDKPAITAAQKTVAGDTVEATTLLREMDAIQNKAALERQVADEKLRTDENIKNLRQKEIERLEEERILLTQGAEAARAFNLVKQGLSDTDAQALAKQQTSNDLLKPKEPKEQKAVSATINQAFEARLLTRGPADDMAKMTAQNSAITAAELKRLNATMDREARERAKQPKIVFKHVG